MYIKPTPVKNSFKKVIQYHFKKIEKGRGELLEYGGEMNVMPTPLSFSAKMDKISGLNTHARLSNIGWDISISFEPGEIPGKETLESLAEDIRKELGFADRAYILFAHRDTDHFHLHLVINSVDADGKANETMRGFYGKDCLRIAGHLSQKYGLIPPPVREKEKLSGNLLSMENYRLYRNWIREVKKNPYLISGLAPKTVSRLKSGPLKNEEMMRIFQKDEIILNKISENTDTETIHDLKESIKKTAQEYRKIFNEENRKPETWVSFYREKTGNYIRHTKNNNGFTYGIATRGKISYFNEKQLGKGFSFGLLSEQPQAAVKNAPTQLISFIKRTGNNALRSSRDLNEFAEYLQKRGISVSYSSNARGIYGISFTSTDKEGNTKTVKGSETGLSWNRIRETLMRNNAYNIRVEKERVYEINPVHVGVPVAKIFGNRKPGSRGTAHGESEYDSIDFYGNKKKGRSR